ncbi:MAG TPA: UrcA family protein [Woeseiaceae bacterium]|nr:UrcA family protein [Woeseiaceae bacterium]
MNRSDNHRPPWLAAAVSTLALGLGAGHALAAPAPSVKVAWSDLDLSKPAGTEILYGRLQAAARTVCDRGDVDARDIERFNQFRSCYDQSMQAALKQVDHRGLYSLHKRKLETSTAS